MRLLPALLIGNLTSTDRLRTPGQDVSIAENDSLVFAPRLGFSMLASPCSEHRASSWLRRAARRARTRIDSHVGSRSTVACSAGKFRVAAYFRALRGGG